MVLRDLVNRPARWLGAQGPHSELVLSSRVRIARNLAEVPFTNRASARELEDVERVSLKAALGTSPFRGGLAVRWGVTPALERTLLAERHLVSRDFAGEEGPRAILVSSSEEESLVVNEEDHLRIQAIQSGLRLEEAWEAANRIDSALEGSLAFAYDERWGYLTACPTNVGTGLRASVLLHLPALVLTKEINKVLQGVAEADLSVRGFYGEGSEVRGSFFQVSNQATLGKSEEDVVGQVQRWVEHVMEYERRAMAVLRSDALAAVEDKVFRARALLESARLLSSEEVVGLGSAVRLGVVMGILNGLSFGTLNELLVAAQPAHLQFLCGREMAPEERDKVRADLVRQRLAAER
jgi:protein arginine kinase